MSDMDTIYAGICWIFIYFSDVLGCVYKSNKKNREKRNNMNMKRENESNFKWIEWLTHNIPFQIWNEILKKKKSQRKKLDKSSKMKMNNIKTKIKIKSTVNQKIYI